MKKYTFALMLVMLFSIISVQGEFSSNIVGNTTIFQSNNIEITNTTIWDGENKIFANESLTVGVNGNLTIINSYLNFSNYDDTGIIVDGGSLTVKHSIIEYADKCISGSTNGSVVIERSKFFNCKGDTIELEGDYTLDFINSDIDGGSGHGLDLFGLSSATIKNSLFEDLGKNGIVAEDVASFDIFNASIIRVDDRGMRIRGSGDFSADMIDISATVGDGLRSDVDGHVSLSRIDIRDAGGDGLQLENAETAELNAVEIYDAVEDGLKGENIGSLSLESVTIRSSGSDGLDLELTESVHLSDVEVINTVETGLELELIGDISITDTKVTGGDLIGVELVNVTLVNIKDSKFSDNGDAGFVLDSVGTFILNGSEVSRNLNGIIAVNVTNAQVSYTIITDNVNNAIDATDLGMDRTFEATNNWWGTTDGSSLSNVGSVNIDPVLNSIVGLYGYVPVTTSSSTPAGTETTMSDQNPLPFAYLVSIFAMLTLPILRRKN